MKNVSFITLFVMALVTLFSFKPTESEKSICSIDGIKLCAIVNTKSNACPDIGFKGVSWDAYSGAAYYYVDIVDLSTGGFVFNNTTVNTAINFYPIAGHTYKVSIEAFNSNNSPLCGAYDICLLPQCGCVEAGSSE